MYISKAKKLSKQLVQVKFAQQQIAGRATRNSYKDVYAHLVSRGLKLPTKKIFTITSVYEISKETKRERERKEKCAQSVKFIEQFPRFVEKRDVGEACEQPLFVLALIEPRSIS